MSPLTRTFNRVCCHRIHDTNTRINSPIPFRIQRYLHSENLTRVPLGLFGITGLRAYAIQYMIRQRQSIYRTCSKSLCL